jgi:hypothetical protein
MLCFSAEGVGADLIPYLEVGASQGDQVESLAVSYQPPALTLVDPVIGPIQGGSTVTLTGTNLGSSSLIDSPEVNISSALTTCTILTQDHEKITCKQGISSKTGPTKIKAIIGDQASNSMDYYVYDAATASSEYSPFRGNLKFSVSGSGFFNASFIGLALYHPTYMPSSYVIYGKYDSTTRINFTSPDFSILLAGVKEEVAFNLTLSMNNQTWYPLSVTESLTYYPQANVSSLSVTAAPLKDISFVLVEGYGFSNTGSFSLTFPQHDPRFFNETTYEYDVS